MDCCDKVFNRLNLTLLEGRVAEEQVLGFTPDISSYAQFDWYQHVYYWDPTNGFPEDKKSVGHWLGVAEVATDVMAYFFWLRQARS